ncbi:MAG: pseudaminic acid synthase [Flammeovirgaceae bacterium]|nr:pseudaminic acid synthase [Flammeovirgaceae bacterium]
MKPSITINGRRIGTDEPVYIIAEMSANHDQDFDKAVQILKAMKESGADAVKLQTYTADTMTIDCDNTYFQIGEGTIWEGRNLYDLYKEAYTPWEWQPKLKKIANDLGMDLFSTPFDDTAVDFLEEMDVPAYKIASFELNDLPLIRKVAATGKPMIMSTGMATKEEITEAIDTAISEKNNQIVLLKCTSAYPAPPESMHLNTIPDMQKKFAVPVGLSDHTLETEVPVVAVALGACVIEKHFTLSRNDPGPDSAFSLEPQEFREMVDAVRAAERNPPTDLNATILGNVLYGGSSADESSKTFRRSLFAVENIAQGQPLTPKNVRCIRPGYGIAPKHRDEVIGKTATKDIPRGTPLSWDLMTV